MSMSSPPTRLLFVGGIVTPASQIELTLLHSGLLGVDNDGTIAFVEDLSKLPDIQNDEGDDGHSTPRARSLERGTLHIKTRPTPTQDPLPPRQRRCIQTYLSASHPGWDLDECHLTVLPYGSFLTPGLIDTHQHACQVPNIGLGQQYELLDWLNHVTFPREARFSSDDYARKTYESVVQRTIDCGTTTACYYATLHLDATKILAEVANKRGQRAFVGKCQMDRNAPDYYVEASAAQSIEDTKAFIGYCEQLAQLGPGADTSTSRMTRATSVSSSTSSATSDGTSPSDDESLASPLSDPEEDAILMSQSVAKLSKTLDEVAEATPEAAPARPTSKAQSETNDTSTVATPPTPSVACSSPSSPSIPLSSALVQPILTPRFGIACTDSLLTSISAVLSRDPSLRLQTHLSESLGEIAFTRSLFPSAPTYTAMYDHFGLLGPRTVLAHAVHLDESEMKLVKERGCGIAHCPNSNLNLRSGTMRVGEMLNRGIKCGLGTDVSGGFSLGMLSAVREASCVAKVVQFGGKEAATKVDGGEGNDGDIIAPIGGYDFLSRPLLPATLLWLATVGGAQVASVDDRTGSLEVGKDFDALLVRLVEPEDEDDNGRKPYRGNPSCFVDDGEPLADLVEKFLFTADDRNLARVYVKGRMIGGVDFHRRQSME